VCPGGTPGQGAPVIIAPVKIITFSYGIFCGCLLSSNIPIRIRITSTTFNYIIFPVALFILPAWELIRNGNESGLKKITKLGWVMFAFAMLSIGLSVFSIKVGDKEKADAISKEKNERELDKKELIKDVNDALKKDNLNFNPKTKTINTIKVSKIIGPILDLAIYPDKKNPMLIATSKPDSIVYKIDIGCINDGIAYISWERCILFSVRGGEIIPTGYFKPVSLKNVMIYGHKGWSLQNTFKVKNKPDFIDTNYLFLRIAYSNKPLFGKDLKLFRRVFYIIYHPNETAFDDKYEIKEADNQPKYKLLENLLVDYKYW